MRTGSKSSKKSLTVETRELTPDLWPSLENLFGSRGACGGCWCMAWRVERGGKLWQELQGERAKAAMKDLVHSGRAHGILAFAKGEAVGWCSFGPRHHFPRIERMSAYQREDTDGVWSVNCFFIPSAHRNRGVARQLLRAAVEACRRHGASVVEGYPVPLTSAGNRLPAAFTWTGPLSLFQEQGFEVVQALAPSRPLVRLKVGVRE